MSVSLENYSLHNKRVPMRDLIEGLQRTLERNHLKILEAARRDWEKKHPAIDPTDSCASISVSDTSQKRKPRLHVLPDANLWSPS